MSAHCSIPDPPAEKTSVSTLTIALAGNPNSGKTTIFNALTGLRQKVANYPGVTVEKKTGRCKLPATSTDGGRIANVIDLPGTYSLITRSIDEQIAASVLRGLCDDTAAPDVVVVVVDASNLQRNFYLVSQLIEVGRPLVVALNMMDVAERRGIRVDAKKLAAQLGVPVVAIVGHKRRGIDELKRAITEARIAPLPEWSLPTAMQLEIAAVTTALETTTPSRPFRAGSVAERLLIGDQSTDLNEFKSHASISSLLKSSSSRLSNLGIDPMQADIEAHYRWIDAVATACSTGFQPVTNEAEHGLVARDTGTLDYARPAKHLTEKIDAILIHKIWGLLIFAVIMATLFVSIFWMAAPIMDGLTGAIEWLGTLVANRLPDGPIHDLWTDGIVAGVGAVIVFIPQIALLFLFLAIMEDSGYLARAAFLMDRLLSKVGLHGKSFIPLLSSFACAIPGIMATRTIESRRDRLATIFIAPFMSCSARLPVYTLLIGTFFAGMSALTRGGIMLALYALGIIAAVITAAFFKLGAKKQYAQTFILEMPSYKVPQPSQVARQVYTNSLAFLTKAGTTIFCLSVILWAMTYYPRLPHVSDGVRRDQWLIDTMSSTHIEGAKMVIQISSQTPGWENWENVKQVKADAQLAQSVVDSKSLSQQEKLDKLWSITNPDLKQFLTNRADQAVAAEQLRHSIAGRIGHFIEPVIRPLGFDWKMGVGLVGAFAAREVFVSTMGIVYSVGKDDEDTEPLANQMLADTYPDGRKVWSPLVATSLLVWFVIAMQCMSTLAIVKRETGGWKWPMIMLVYMNALAYVACLAVYQVGRIWFT